MTTPITLMILLEKWEHPFTGKDYYPDADPGPTFEYHQGMEAHERRLTEHYADLKDNDGAAVHERILQHYTASGASRLNSALYRQKTLENIKDRDPSIAEDIVDLDNALHKHRTPHDMHVYSGIEFNPKRLGHQGDQSGIYKVHLPAYTSASLHPKIAEYFGKRHDSNDGAINIVKIHVPKGSRGAYIDHISLNQGEREFVLPRGSKLHIHPEPTVTMTKGSFPDKLHVWHAKLVHDGVEPVGDGKHFNSDDAHIPATNPHKFEW